jgi:quercetin dioxygenase-like cupin family protein
LLALGAGGVALATPPSGETPTPLAGGKLVASANVSRTVTGGHVSIKASGALDALMLSITIKPGGTGGWHEHAGPLISVVKQGTLTIVDAHCKRHTLKAGSAFISSGASPDKDENLSSKPVAFDVTFLVPHGTMSPRIDAPAPAGCTA